jgi:predicted ArsR family transcriptional regulator
MRYQKIFNESDILLALEDSPLMLRKIAQRVSCSEMTLRKLLKPLIESGEVEVINIGSSDKKPVNLYRNNVKRKGKLLIQ